MFRRRAVKKAKKIFIILAFYSLWLINCPVHRALAQGREYLRTRSGSLAAEQNLVPGQEAPKVEYFIAVDDVFVWQNPDLSKSVIIGPDGQISYPLVGRILAVGLTPVQLEDKLKKKLSEYVKNPEVSVMMRKYSGNKIIILGEVGYPGIYTYKGTINLIDAIALAGDFTPAAHSDSVILVRGNLDEKPEAKRINLIQAITRGTSDARIILQPNDVIFVPKTFVANLNKFISDIGPIIGAASSSINLRQQVRRINHRDDFGISDNTGF
jgi:polysaccharide export outer membrane protein